MIAPGMYEAQSVDHPDRVAYVVVHQPVVVIDAGLARQVARLERDLQDARRELERHEL